MRAGPELRKKDEKARAWREWSFVLFIRFRSCPVPGTVGPKRVPFLSGAFSFRMVVLVRIWMCQKKKAKQKHRNSASASADSRTIHRDWKDENSGFARVVLYAFDYRAPIRFAARDANGSCLGSFRGSVRSSSRRRKLPASPVWRTSIEKGWEKNR